jgi:hypothetical protein
MNLRQIASESCRYTWEPVVEPGVTPRLEYLQINEDNTFLIKAKMDSGRGDLKGTYTIKDGKLFLEGEELKNEKLSGTITNDGRLKLTKGDEEQKDRGSLYFIKK